MPIEHWHFDRFRLNSEPFEDRMLDFTFSAEAKLEGLRLFDLPFRRVPDSKK